MEESVPGMEQFLKRMQAKQSTCAEKHFAVMAINKEIRLENHVSYLVCDGWCVTRRDNLSVFNTDPSWVNLQTPRQVLPVRTLLSVACRACWKVTPWQYCEPDTWNSTAWCVWCFGSRREAKFRQRCILKGGYGVLIRNYEKQINTIMISTSGSDITWQLNVF